LITEDKPNTDFTYYDCMFEESAYFYGINKISHLDGCGHIKSNRYKKYWQSRIFKNRNRVHDKLIYYLICQYNRQNQSSSWTPEPIEPPKEFWDYNQNNTTIPIKHIENILELIDLMDKLDSAYTNAQCKFPMIFAKISEHSDSPTSLDKITYDQFLNSKSWQFSPMDLR
jgi:hypothetical protein